MYAVSNAYKQAMKADSQFSRITGTVGDVTFTDIDIVSGSLTLQNQCGESDVILGAVYVGELHCTFQSLNIPRYSWVGLDITLSYWQCVDEANDTWEEVPLGIYRIDNAEHTEQGVNVTAYDRMNLFEEPCSVDSSTGYAYDLLLLACTECHVTLGMTRAEVEAFPNTGYLINLYGENDIVTWRDYLSQLSAAIGAFCTIDRAGRLVLRKYAQNAVDTIDWDERATGGSFADFETKYTAIELEAVVANKVETFTVTPDDGLTYSLGANPFIQSGVVSLRETMCRNILTALQSVHYVPFSFQMLGNPAYDLGDVLRFSNGIGDGNKISCLTSYSWTFHAQYNATGAGTDPALATALDKPDKELASVMSKVSASETHYYTYTNAYQLSVSPNQTRQFLDIRFATIVKATVIFQCEILLNASVDDTKCVITYKQNGVEIARHPKETWIDGDHVLHLLYVMRLNDNELYRFTAEIKAIGGTITIPVQGVHAVISGRGLASEKDWDGFIDIEETAHRIPCDGEMDVFSFSATPTIAQVVPIVPAITDETTLIDISDNFDIKTMSDKILVNKKQMKDYTWGQLSQKTWAELKDEYIWG